MSSCNAKINNKRYFTFQFIIKVTIERKLAHGLSIQ
jgi:hypothetical protein